MLQCEAIAKTCPMCVLRIIKLLPRFDQTLENSPIFADGDARVEKKVVRDEAELVSYLGVTSIVGGPPHIAIFNRGQIDS